jgi:hypothetical protein
MENRREFLKSMAIAAAVSPKILGASDRIRVGVIGTGTRGRMVNGFSASIRIAKLLLLAMFACGARGESRVVASSTTLPASLYNVPALMNSHAIARAKAADEVIALPLGPNITLDEVQMVSRCVKNGLRTLGI